MRRFIKRVFGRIGRDGRNAIYYAQDQGNKVMVALHLKSASPFLVIPDRAAFSALIPRSSDGLILEIGPLDRPTVSGSDVRYFDICPTEELRKKAEMNGLDQLGVPKIDYWEPNGDLGVITEKFASVVSSHCIEHQPDLVRHLQKVERLLLDDGRYFLVIPDKRYCFDHYLPESRLSEVVRAFDEERHTPNLYSVLEHRALVTGNDPAHHWRGEHGLRYSELKSMWQSAAEEYANAHGAYIDVHIWQFTPESFVAMVEGLFQLGLINFTVEKIFSTPRNQLEFFCILQKSEVMQRAL